MVEELLRVFLLDILLKADVCTVGVVEESFFHLVENSELFQHFAALHRHNGHLHKACIIPHGGRPLVCLHTIVEQGLFQHAHAAGPPQYFHDKGEILIGCRCRLDERDAAQEVGPVQIAPQTGMK